MFCLMILMRRWDNKMYIISLLLLVASAPINSATVTEYFDYPINKENTEYFYYPINKENNEYDSILNWYNYMDLKLKNIYKLCDEYNLAYLKNNFIQDNINIKKIIDKLFLDNSDHSNCIGLYYVYNYNSYLAYWLKCIDQNRKALINLEFKLAKNLAKNSDSEDYYFHFNLEFELAKNSDYYILQEYHQCVFSVDAERVLSVSKDYYFYLLKYLTLLNGHLNDFIIKYYNPNHIARNDYNRTIKNYQSLLNNESISMQSPNDSSHNNFFCDFFFLLCKCQY